MSHLLFLSRSLCLWTVALPLSLLALQPARAQTLVPNSDFTAPLQNTWVWASRSGEPRVVDAAVEGNPHVTKAIQLDYKANTGASPWDARFIATKSAFSIKKSDLIMVQFWGRSTLKTNIVAVYQQAAQPYEKTVREVVSLRPKWKQYTYFSPAKASYNANESQFEFWLGQATGRVEIAGLRVENVGAISEAEATTRFGPKTLDYYGGEEPDDSWIPAADARIEKYRKGDLKLRIVDKAGKPIPDAEVVLKQTKSAFKWGVAVGPKMLEQSPDGEKYRSQMKRLYNTIVIGNQLKWKWGDGNPAAQKDGQQMLDWLEANHFEVRGHNLVWGSSRYLPDRLKTLTTDQLRIEVENRVKETAQRYKGQVYVWDVVNEAATETELWDKIGWDFFTNSFRWAKDADPGALTAYNDYNIANEAPDNGSMRKKVEARIQQLIDAKVPLDILGDQAHISPPLTSIPRVLAIWDEWGQKYGKPIEITEFDVRMPDDKVHEKYVHDFLIAAFSNPNVEALLQWGFWEKDHWLGAAGTMFRADWSPRPAELTYEDLVLNKWRTNQTLKTSKDGVVQTRGFLGDYEVEIRAKQGRKTIPVALAKSGLKQQISVP